MFIAGSFTGVTVVASIPIRSRNRQDIFLAKYDGDGILLWFKQVTGGGPGATVTVDAGGNSYITGEFFGDGVFDGLPRYPERVRALFVAKYNPAGKLLWVRREGEGSANPRGATTDDSGNVYVTGTFFGEVKFGSQIIGAKGGEDLFLVKYDTNGNFLWVRAPGGPPFRTGHNVALDRGGNPHVVGIIERTSVFGRTNVVIIDPDENKFLAKYTPDGDFQWVRQFRKGDFDFSNVVSVEVIGVKRPMRSSGSTNSSTTSVLELQKRAEMVTAALNSQNAASGAIASRPVLGLQKSGEFILLFWSKEFADFVLEGSETLMPFPVWETVIVNPESIAEQLVVSIPIRDTVRFYRLRRP